MAASHRNNGGTSARHRVYQVSDGVSWDSYPRFMQQLPQSIQVTFFPVPYGRGLPTDVRWDSSPGSELASQEPLHQSAQRKHTPTLYGKGHCLAGRQKLALDHKALLQKEACDFWALWCTDPVAWYLRTGRPGRLQVRTCTPRSSGSLLRASLWGQCTVGCTSLLRTYACFALQKSCKELSSDHNTLFHCSIVQSRCSRANATRLRIVGSRNKCFLAVTHPCNPAEKSLLQTVLLDTCTPRSSSILARSSGGDVKRRSPKLFFFSFLCRAAFNAA